MRASCMMCRCGSRFEEDLARVRAAREAIGGDRNLMVDANTSLSTRMAMRYADALGAV